MKKIFSTIVAVLLIATFASVSVFADYPGSPDWDHELPTDGKILTGELFGTDPYGAGAEFDKAWDGDSDTFFDPQGVGEANYTAVKLDQAYILTEIRIMPRMNWLDRFNGATIQGSNDGENWTDIFISVEPAVEQDYIKILPADFEDGSNTGYSYYRYVNNTSHGDVGDIELYGNPAGGAAVAEPAPEPEPVPEPEPEPVPEPVVDTAPVVVDTPAPSAPVSTAPVTGDITVIIAGIAVAAIASLLVLKKRTAK